MADSTQADDNANQQRDEAAAADREAADAHNADADRQDS